MAGSSYIPGARGGPGLSPGLGLGVPGCVWGVSVAPMSLCLGVGVWVLGHTQDTPGNTQAAATQPYQHRPRRRTATQPWPPRRTHHAHNSAHTHTHSGCTALTAAGLPRCHNTQHTTQHSAPQACVPTCGLDLGLAYLLTFIL